MFDVQAAWSLGMLGALSLALLAFIRKRRRTADFADARAYKARLPAWVSLTERLLWYAMLAVVAAAGFRTFDLLHRALRPGHEIVGADAVYAVTGVGLIAVPVAMICANWVSWVIPPVRAANLQAMEGSSQSFASANRGLLQFGVVALPMGLIDLVIAVIEPWAF